MKFLQFAFILMLPALFAPLAQADSTRALTVTIYNNDRALVNEVRSMKLPQGTNRMEFLGVPQTIEPQTLRVFSKSSPKKFTVLDMNYEYDLVSTKNLLDRYVGKELKIILPDPTDANERILRKGTLIANNDQPIFRINDEIYVGSYNSIQLPSLPKGLRATPALVWLVNNKGPATQDIDVSYLARGIGWVADYVLTVDRNNNVAGLSGWVTLTNNSGKSFNNANLKLVAGQVNEVTQRYMAASRDMEMQKSLASSMQEESVFEYHLYSLARPVDIANRQVKQVSLLQAPSVKVQKELVCEYDAFAMARKPVKPAVDVFLKFKNDKKSGMGMALPRGIVRAYQESKDKSLLLIGEDRIDHTPKGEEVRLKMGTAFDVTVERKQRSYQKTSKNTYRFAWQITVRNGGEATRTVLLQDLLPGNWKVLKHNHEFKTLHQAGIEFSVQAMPGKDVVITYEATATLP